jgi:hypothetical protein
VTVVDALPALIDAIRDACHDRGTDADADASAELSRLAARLDEPLAVAIAGKVKAGKSTLLNALVGEELAPTDASECTQVVTWYRNGPTYRVMIDVDDGARRQVPFHRDDGALELDLGDVPIERVRRIVVDWPSARLTSITLIDTPGLDSVNTAVSDRTRALFGAGERAPGDVATAASSEADAVIYLMRHLHRTDLSFLDAFRDDAHAGASPISAIAVLSRADEVGACRLDAMSVARRIADSWRSDPRLRRLVQTIVPVAGLVAQAGASLRESEYRSLATIAALPRAEIDALLLTADRFIADNGCGLTPIEREQLLARLGIYGVRLSISLIRLGAVSSASTLAPELTTRSGATALRSMLTTVLAERREVLKARVGIAGIDRVLSTLSGPRFDPFRAELERIEANAHEFVEVQLLHALRAGDLRFRPEEADELERLLGTIGAPVASRLGIDDERETRDAVLAAVERWRARAENPMTSLPLKQAAEAVARTYEGLLPS